jgi:hypothetical protein
MFTQNIFAVVFTIVLNKSFNHYFLFIFFFLFFSFYFFLFCFIYLGVLFIWVFYLFGCFIYLGVFFNLFYKYILFSILFSKKIREQLKIFCVYFFLFFLFFFVFFVFFCFQCSCFFNFGNLSVKLFPIVFWSQSIVLSYLNSTSSEKKSFPIVF